MRLVLRRWHRSGLTRSLTPASANRPNASMYFSESTRYPRKGESAIRDMESRLGMVKIFSYGDEGGGNALVKHGVLEANSGR